MSKKELLGSILNSLPVGIMFCDKDCRIRFINKEYAQILDKGIEEILGKVVTELIPKSRIPKVLESGKDELGDLCIIPGKDTYNSAVVNRIVLRSSEGNLQGVVSHAIFSKVSDLHQLAEKLTEKVAVLDKKLLSYQKRMQSALRFQYTLDCILGNNEALLEQKRLLTRYAQVDSPVLILGETGTGKELFAHSLHAASSRAQSPLVSINCAAIPKELFESELFGYAEGAFSGAHKDGKVGLVELADGGTLFLDEIGDLSMDAQSKLLRFLENKTFCRVGSITSRKVDFRLVCATNRDLLEMVVKSRFREDLFYRVSPLQINVPPLRRRKEDIPLLMEHFLNRLDRDELTFSPATMEVMTSYLWPGNIRALRNVITHAASTCTTGQIELHHLPAWLLDRVHVPYVDAPANATPQVENHKRTPAGHGSTLHEILSRQESRTLVEHLRKNGGNVTKAAQKLGVSRATLYNKFKKLGVNPRAALGEL